MDSNYHSKMVQAEKSNLKWILGRKSKFSLKISGGGIQFMQKNPMYLKKAEAFEGGEDQPTAPSALTDFGGILLRPEVLPNKAFYMQNHFSKPWSVSSL